MLVCNGTTCCVFENSESAIRRIFLFETPTMSGEYQPFRNSTLSTPCRATSLPAIDKHTCDTCGEHVWAYSLVPRGRPWFCSYDCALTWRFTTTMLALDLDDVVVDSE